MRLHLVFLPFLCLAATSKAALSFYGSEGPSSDHVTCTTNNATVDNALVGLLATYYPGEAVTNASRFRFPVPMICGEDLPLSIALNCQDYNATASCIPGNMTTPNTAKRHLPTSKPLMKRAEAKCDQYTGECRNEYQSTTGFCSSGYKKQVYNVPGYTADIWCSKLCTTEEFRRCPNVVCQKYQPRCEQNPTKFTCENALIMCKGSPVKTPQELCSATAFPNQRDLVRFCQGRQCFEYEDGRCTLDAKLWSEYQDQQYEKWAKAEDHFADEDY
ncbi:hypothetical protein BDV19DRAFT_389944 [Aspergillus venezuelensis]